MFLFRKKNEGSPEEQKLRIEETMIEAAKDKLMPYWAVDDAAKALIKKKIASNADTERDRLVQELYDKGYIVVNIATKGSGKNNKPKKAEEMVWRHMVTFSDMIIKMSADPNKELAGLLNNCEYMYFYLADGATADDAKKVVAGLFDEILEKVRNGEIGS